MSLFKQFKTDPDLETKGIFINFGETKDGRIINFRLARAGGSNKAYEKAMELATKPIRRQLMNDTVDNAQLLRITRKVFAETVVLGWENVEDEDDKPIPFSKENCLKLFEELPDLFLDVQEQARKAVLYRSVNLQADSGN